MLVQLISNRPSSRPDAHQKIQPPGSPAALLSGGAQHGRSLGGNVQRSADCRLQKALNSAPNYARHLKDVVFFYERGAFHHSTWGGL
jgi:hypothetical protein